MNVAAIIARVPRIWLFVTTGVVQIALIALMVADRMQILRSGIEVILQTRPVDPRDFLRGDYVALSYDISSVPAGALEAQPAGKRGASVFVRLTPNADGFYQAISVQADPTPVTSPDILIRGRIAGTGGCGAVRTRCTDLRIKYGIESYFVPQGEGRDIEHAHNQGKVAIIAAVTPAGRAAIKRLLIDGKPVYDEPLF
jgi:uncharacterized membrane-anchored protein